MRRFLTILLLLGSLAAARAYDAFSDTNSEPSAGSPRQSEATAGRVIKVLPLLLDLQGHDALSPSLFDRDAYQAHLRQHTNEVSAIRFDVLWTAANKKGATFKLRAELLGVGPDSLPRRTVLETNVTPRFFRRWTELPFGGEEFKKFGSLVAWRVTLWNGDRLIGEQKSFLW